MKRADLTGLRFGKLTAIKVSGSKPVKWECLCDCGRTTHVLAGGLTKKVNATQSCGCKWASDIVIVQGYTSECQTGKFTVVKMLGGENVLCRFEDGHELVFQRGNVRVNNVWNPYHPFIYGKGYIGVGKYGAKDKAHEYWSKMMQRAYCEKYKAEHPTYEKVTVCSEWLNYQNFAEWCVSRKQYGKLKFNLDKDIVIRGNKVYAPDKCSLVPQRVNKLLVTKNLINPAVPLGVKIIRDKISKEIIGYTAACADNGSDMYFGYHKNIRDAFFAYKIGKEALIKSVAKDCKEDLDDLVYDALMRYTVVDVNGFITS